MYLQFQILHGKENSVIKKNKINGQQPKSSRPFIFFPMKVSKKRVRLLEYCINVWILFDTLAFKPSQVYSWLPRLSVSVQLYFLLDSLWCEPLGV